MFPIHIIGVALASRMLLSKKNGEPGKVERKSPIKLFPPRKPTNAKTSTHSNPFEALIKGINRQLSGIIKPQSSENFDEIVGKFIPQDSIILTPKHPSHSKSIGLADLDGDSRNELIVSFRHSNEIKTIILKKENNDWYKATEVANPGYESINYREFVDFTGEGKKQLIIALSSQGMDPVLHGYSLDGGRLNGLFSLSYNRLQVIKVPGNDRDASVVSLAVWNREENDTYNIELLQWNGSQLVPTNDIGTYYSSNVVPYYLKKVKREPDLPQNWYNLADSLVKAGLKRDALIASEVGMRYDSSPELSDQFAALKDKIEKI